MKNESKQIYTCRNTGNLLLSANLKGYREGLDAQMQKKDAKENRCGSNIVYYWEILMAMMKQYISKSVFYASFACFYMNRKKQHGYTQQLSDHVASWPEGT